MPFSGLDDPDHHHAPAAGLPALVVTYHYVRPANSDGVTGLTPDAFERQLRAIGATRRFVTAEQFAEAVELTGEGEPGTALITFDDAVRDQFDHAFPVLSRLGVPAVFYAPMRPADASLHPRERWTPQHLLHALAQTLGWEELERRGMARLGDVRVDQAEIDRIYHYEEPRKRLLKYLLAFAVPPARAAALLTEINEAPYAQHAAPELRADDWFMPVEQLIALQDAGHSLGNHGYDHAALGTLSPEAQEADLRRARDMMDHLTGRAWRTLAYPFGSATPATGKIARRLGYSLCFTTRDRVDCKYLDDALAREHAAVVRTLPNPAAHGAAPGRTLRRTA